MTVTNGAAFQILGVIVLRRTGCKSSSVGSYTCWASTDVKAKLHTRWVFQPNHAKSTQPKLGPDL